MFKPFALFVGLRYAKAKGKNYFISFISFASMLGIAIGVAALITVLSVMNGFSKEIRVKMLNFTPHILVRSFSGNLPNHLQIIDKIKKNPDVLQAESYIFGQGLLTENGTNQPVVISGIEPNNVKGMYPSADYTKMTNGGFGIILGKKLADSLDLAIGDKVTLLIPETNVSITGISPRIKRLVVVDIFDTGTYFDNRNAFVNINDAAKLFRVKDAVTGIQLKVVDELKAPQIARELYLSTGENYWFSNWTQDYASFFDALNMEKIVMWCILCLIIAVAAFNLVSSLVMMVNEKRQDIAILRSMGASPKSIMTIFIAQGGLVGLLGTLLGTGFGLLLAQNITNIAAYLQNIFNVQFVAEDVYLISFLPSEIKMLDVSLVSGFAILVSLIATIYPAWRAAKVAPAEALRYE